MRLDAIPVIGPLLAAGADDRVFDALLVLGPVVIVAIRLLGRTPVSLALAVAYTVGFAAYILSEAIR
ncbi:MULTISPECIES: hypothetical protein [Halobacterium]|uniref:Uncharacterized protein n=4 Tax=Halobacterium salinarum TaxID=2242 RepID=Q9HQ82_HALSA|nr:MULTISPECIES: hypothetical protein [Halobacterium]AAG19634.1 hypothetical protein VNG_1283H [Halobacterium salinarum NRC-1]MBB6090324.1 hypothetical protein [Halobacterium salinarum]MCF2165143.1 hypothetical protein [Halobacterium salinarum]MCF2168048.1 hypothetical protein [Halobacterium salinarum]MCF2239704.1 hypothetical protein [Halobacterium salinarum]